MSPLFGARPPQEASDAPTIPPMAKKAHSYPFYHHGWGRWIGDLEDHIFHARQQGDFELADKLGDGGTDPGAGEAATTEAATTPTSTTPTS